MTAPPGRRPPAPVDLVIDGQAIQGAGRRRGIGRYGRELAAAIRAARPAWRLRLTASSRLGDLDPIPGVEVVRYDPPAYLHGCYGPTTELIRLHYADWLRGLNPDCTLTLSPFEAEGASPRFVGVGPPSVTVFYDAIMLLFPLEYMRRHPQTWEFVSRQMRRVLATDALLAISEATRHDLVDLLGDVPPVANIQGAVASALPVYGRDEAVRLAADLFARKGLDPAAAGGGFLLYVGGGDFRKNLPQTVHAYARLPKATRAGRAMVFVGELGPMAHTLRELAEGYGVGPALYLMGHITDAELAALYQAARVFAFPSLYEGLGLPMLESLSCGTDVVAGDTSSIREFSGPGTDYFDPADPDDMAHVLYRVLSRPGPADPAAKRAFANRFTWAATAEAACRAIEATVAKPWRAPTPTRVVWRRSFPPTVTADELELFCEVLNARDVTLMRLPDDAPLPPVLAPLVRCRAPHEIQKAEELTPTAVHVYELDSVRDLRQAAAWLVRRPGLVILSAELAKSDAWNDPHHAKALKAADRVIVRGDGSDFARVFAEAEAIGRTADRQWRNLVVAALDEAPPMPDGFIDEWATLRAAAPARAPETAPR